MYENEDQHKHEYETITENEKQQERRKGVQLPALPAVVWLELDEFSVPKPTQASGLNIQFSARKLKELRRNQ